MNAREPLSVDLANRDDIRKKLPLAKQLYRAKRRELASLEQEVESWGELVDLLARIVGEPAEPRLVRTSTHGGGPGQRQPSRGGKRAPGQEKAVKALERASRPMGPTELFRFMVAEDLDPPANANALGANLWAAAKSNRIKKTEDGGLYAPLDWEPDQEGLIASKGSDAEASEK